MEANDSPLDLLPQTPLLRLPVFKYLLLLQLGKDLSAPSLLTITIHGTSMISQRLVALTADKALAEVIGKADRDQAS